MTQFTSRCNDDGDDVFALQATAASIN